MQPVKPKAMIINFTNDTSESHSKYARPCRMTKSGPFHDFDFCTEKYEIEIGSVIRNFENGYRDLKKERNCRVHVISIQIRLKYIKKNYISEYYLSC